MWSDRRECGVVEGNVEWLRGMWRGGKEGWKWVQGRDINGG